MRSILGNATEGGVGIILGLGPLNWVNYSIHGPPDPPTPEKGPITMEFDEIC